MANQYSTPIDFWAYIRVGGLDECWEWQGCRHHRGGYGYYKGRPAAREVWRRVRGLIPRGLLVCHRCDNPLCCNPLHLFLGTYLDNMLDKIAKGRFRAGAGERHRSARLTEATVRDLRTAHSAGVSCGELGRRYGISGVAASKVVRRLTWRFVA